MTAVSETQLVRSICKDCFFEFVKEFWSTVIQEEPIWNWHIEYLCGKIQQRAERVFAGLPKEQDLIVNVPPGTTKSTIFSVLFPAWAMTRMPHARILVSTHTDNLGMDLSRRSRDVIKSEKYQRCFPEIQIRDDQDTKGYWANTAGGWRLTCTIGGKNPMGFHAHFLIVDDPIDPQKVHSDAEITEANRFMNEVLPSRKVNKRVSVTFLIMQRLHQNDPTGNWLSQMAGDVEHVCLPADTSYKVIPSSLAENYVDGLLDPIRLPRSVLKREEKRGSFFYSGQYGQDPVPLSGGMFRVHRLHIDIPPVSFRRIVRYWDKAGTLGDGAFTVGVKMGLEPASHGDEPKFWILDVVRGQWESSERERIIKHTAMLDGKSVIIGVEQEPGSAGKESAENTAKRLAGYRVRLDRPTGDKAERADPYSVQVNSGNVYLKKGAEWIQDYIDEMRHFPDSTYKDQIDASSGAFAILTKTKAVVGAL